jgi:V-type H+-transporting ATPase subunit C
VDFADTFKAAAREKRFVVREYTRAGAGDAAAGDAETALADVEIQVAEKQAGLERWCRTHYGEAFSAWVHLKVIRAFVESVLRYGLSPVGGAVGGRPELQESNFMLAALKVSRGKSLQLKAALDKLLHVNAPADDDDEEGEYHPYCKLEFTIA